MAERHQYDQPPQEGVEEEALTGDAVVDLENILYREVPELVTAKEHIHSIMIDFVNLMAGVKQMKR